jgi:hypothetical protein
LLRAVRYAVRHPDVLRKAAEQCRREVLRYDAGAWAARMEEALWSRER